MKNMDDILKQALTPKDEPDFWLNESILSQSKEAKPMKKMNRKKFASVAFSCALMLGIGSVSVYAAWQYLMPDQVIDEMEMGEDKLADAFSEENAVYINETQSYGGYEVTLLGITSGENLTKYKTYVNDNSVKTFDAANSDNPAKSLLADGFVELNDRSYILFAVENKNQTFKDISEFEAYLDISPIIMGYDYETCTGVLANGSGSRSMIKDGVIYYMYECNNLEKFAEHDIYMCVSDDLPAVSEYSYIYDKDAGTIARNEEYEGLNALFMLPIDPEKADPKAAAEEMKAYEERCRRVRESESEETLSEKIQKAYDFVDQITPENINDYAVPITEEGATQTFGPTDAQGRISIDCSYYRCQFRTKMPVDKMFPDGKTEYVSSGGITDNNLDTLLIEHYKLNPDGTVTLQFYAPKLPE